MICSHRACSARRRQTRRPPAPWRVRTCRCFYVSTRSSTRSFKYFFKMKSFCDFPMVTQPLINIDILLVPLCVQQADALREAARGVIPTNPSEKGQPRNLFETLALLAFQCNQRDRAPRCHCRRRQSARRNVHRVVRSSERPARRRSARISSSYFF